MAAWGRLGTCMRFMKRLTKISLIATGLLMAVALVAGPQATETSHDASTKTVVFVCEHGSAKSVIAAAHFNRLAAERGLPYRAVARGLNPDSEVPSGVLNGIKSDGLRVSGDRPTRVSRQDVQNAERTVTIAVELPASIAATTASLVQWKDVPSVSEGYTAAREAIVRHISELLDQLAAKAR